ncbi:MAG: rod shape-determining protein MreC [Saprospiraceae bacterium]|nr:rod shape-determining protein MreC [Saprospiraceae bacterium]
MQKLFLYLVRFNGVFIFLILEVIALSLYFTRNTTTEKSAFLSSANGVVGGLFEYSNRVYSYWSLASTNKELAEENARLRMSLPGAQYKQLVTTIKVQDTTYAQQFKYTAALIVNNSTNNPNNFITINRGKKHGLLASSGVVSGTGEGIVGITRKVSPHYSVVMSVLNRAIRVSAKIKRNNYFGVLTWDGKRTDQMVLESVPKHAEINKGDTIVTSGFSTMFPEGILIGTVDSTFIESGSNFHTAYINLFADVGNLQYVYVINDLMRDERKKLEEAVANE